MICIEVRATLHKDWLASLSGDLACNAYGLRELLGIHDGTHISVLSFDVTRDFIEDICLNWDFTSVHHVSRSVKCPWYLTFLYFYMSQFTPIHRDNMRFYLFISSLAYVILIYVFYCAIFIFNYVRIKI